MVVLFLPYKYITNDLPKYLYFPAFDCFLMDKTTPKDILKYRISPEEFAAFIKGSNEIGYDTHNLGKINRIWPNPKP